MTPMDNEARTVNRMGELPERTKEFLSKLDEDDIETLEDACSSIRPSAPLAGLANGRS